MNDEAMQDTPDNCLKSREGFGWIARPIKLHGEEARQQVEEKDEGIAKRSLHGLSSPRVKSIGAVLLRIIVLVRSVTVRVPAYA